MKKIALFCILFFISNYASFSNDFSTIYFYRIKSNAESKKPFDIYINETKIGSITNDGRIKYTIYSTGEAEIYVRSPDCETSRIYINIQHNTDYYIKIDGITCFIKEFDISKGKFDFNNPNNFKKSIAALQEDLSNPIIFKQLQIKKNTESVNNNSNIADNSEKHPEGIDILTYFKSDVDIDIPVNTHINDKTFVVIIANENYQKEVSVQFAVNDGKVFKEYCQQTLGIPAKNIHFVQDATYGNMKSEIKWISDVAQAFNGQAKLFFYYAGHGMPNEADKSAYLLPVDGFSSDYETAIKLDDLYSRLNANPTQRVTVFLDACFSGSVRDNGMLASARGVKVRPKYSPLKGNMIVFSAASGEETAYPYKDVQHGLFTYFLLKKLQESKGDVDYQALSNYITEKVKQQSIVVNQKSQTPQLIISPEIENTWQTMKMK